MSILTDYSWWGILLCAAVGILYAAALYFFKKKKSSSGKMRFVLPAIRALTVTAICFLLLSPLVKTRNVQTEKPVVVLLQDNSQSITLTHDSVFYKTQYVEKIEWLRKKLSDKYDVRTLSFGNTVNDGFDRSFSQQATDIFSALEEIKERFKGANLGAVILATDGIYNLGAIPTNADLSPTPIYTIALGDTTICKDAAITNLGFNQITYLNNKFPVEISLKAAKLNGHNSKLTIEKDGKILFSKNIAYTSDEHFQSETVLLEADKAGIQHYTVKLSSCQGEASETNNIRSFSIEVIDGNYKVAVVAHSPHPDVSALKQTLDGMENYETNTFLADEFKENPSKYDFVVLHQLPSGKMSHNTIVENSVKSGVPILFIIGSQTDIERFDNIRLGLSINARRGAFDDATASFNPNFSSFSIDQAVAQDIQSFPPLSVPFGKYSISNGAQTLAFAKIGTVVSENPLVCFAQKNGVRNGFVTGEGLWRWRMADFQQNGTQQNFETLISKIATYLTSNSNKEKFRVVAKKHFSTLDAISFDAELYNDNYELVNTPEATLSVEGNGKTLDFVFGKKSNYYQTSIGTLPQGKYSYTAKTTLGGHNYSKKGEFVVENANYESYNITADHTLLNTLSNENGAHMFYPSQMEQIPDSLDQRNDIKNIMYSHNKYINVINLPWLFVLIVLLLGFEWAARKNIWEV